MEGGNRKREGGEVDRQDGGESGSPSLFVETTRSRGRMASVEVVSSNKIKRDLKVSSAHHHAMSTRRGQRKSVSAKKARRAVVGEREAL